MITINTNDDNIQKETDIVNLVDDNDEVKTNMPVEKKEYLKYLYNTQKALHPEMDDYPSVKIVDPSIPNIKEISTENTKKDNQEEETTSTETVIPVIIPNIPNINEAEDNPDIYKSEDGIPNIVTSPDSFKDGVIYINGEKMTREEFMKRYFGEDYDSDKEFEPDRNRDEETHNPITEEKSGAKYDSGKLELSLVPMQIIRDIAKVRMFAGEKYKIPSNWTKIERRRYIDALMRHMLQFIDDPDSVDEESGLSTLAHIACNVAFLCEMQRSDWDKRKDQITDTFHKLGKE